MSHLRILALCCCAFVSQDATAQQPSAGQDNAIVESLLRIPDAKIGAYPQHSDAIKRYLKKVAGSTQYLRVVEQLGLTDEWNTASGRDIVWRSRFSKACNYLSKIIFATEKPSEQDRYFRAMDFHDPKHVSQVLAQAVRR